MMAQLTDELITVTDDPRSSQPVTAGHISSNTNWNKEKYA